MSSALAWIGVGVFGAVGSWARFASAPWSRPADRATSRSARSSST